MNGDILNSPAERRGVQIVTPPSTSPSSANTGDQGPAPGHDPLEVGFLVFSTSAQVLYLNPPARGFLKRLNLSEKGYATDGALPLILTELYDELVTVVCDRMKWQCWTCVEVKRVIPMQGFRLLLWGLGLPDKQGIEEGRIILALQEIDPCAEASAAHHAEHPHP